MRKTQDNPVLRSSTRLANRPVPRYQVDPRPDHAPDTSSDNTETFAVDIGSSTSDSDETSDSNVNKSKGTTRKARSSKIQSGKNAFRSVDTTVAAPKQNVTFNSGSDTDLGTFRFLNLESYICHCLSTISRLDKSPEDVVAAPSPCLVMKYFGILYLEDLAQMYCPSHDMIIPMSRWEKHIISQHNDWTSSSKQKECTRMAEHIAIRHNLSLNDAEDDLALPGDVEDLITDTPHILNQCHCCPRCEQWVAVDKASRDPERYLRFNHLRKDCTAGPCSDFLSIDVGELRWVHRVRISSAKSRFHAFVLPDDWHPSDITTTTTVPVAPLLIYDPASPISLTDSQKWPELLGWSSYDDEIEASKHIIALRQLISLPSSRSHGSHPQNILEEGLLQVHLTLISYFKSAMVFLHEKHKAVVNAIVSDSGRAAFRIISDGKIPEYRNPMTMLVGMTLRFIHAALTNNTLQFGKFKLRGADSQFTAALDLYCLIIKCNGKVPKNELLWALHNFLDTILRPPSLGNRPIDSLVEQMIFLWACLSGGRYRISKDISSLIAAEKYGLRCVGVHSARVQAQKKDSRSPFYDQPLDEHQAANDEETGDEVMGTEDNGIEDIYSPQPEPTPEEILARIKCFKNAEYIDSSSGVQTDINPSVKDGERNEDTETLILKILTEQSTWLSYYPDKNSPLFSTTYSRVCHIQSVLSKFTWLDGTTKSFDVSRNGQEAVYSDARTVKTVIRYGKWEPLIQDLMKQFADAVSQQLPSGSILADFLNGPISDDLGLSAPHKQTSNRIPLLLGFDRFNIHMMSPSESRHSLVQEDGHLCVANVAKYVLQDQLIKGILSALLTTSTAVTLRPFQFGSMVYDSSNGFSRTFWIVGGRFVFGRPRAKQHNIQFSPTVFWLPRDITKSMIIYLYYQQPFIAQLLEKTGQKDHLYASHVWALPSKLKRRWCPLVWDGSQINKSVGNFTRDAFGFAFGPSLVRQIAQGLLRNKIPALFEVFHNREAISLEVDSYRHMQCLQAYSNQNQLSSLHKATSISQERIAACLIVVDIWQAMHGVHKPDSVWQPMVSNSYMFPTSSYDDLAYTKAQNLKKYIHSRISHTLTEGDLTGGILLLEDREVTKGDLIGTEAAHCFLTIIRTVLFGGGTPRYGQTPPIGGILMEDLAKAGAMILHNNKDTRNAHSAMLSTEFIGIIKQLCDLWSSGTIPWVAISANIFDMHQMAYFQGASIQLDLDDILL